MAKERISVYENEKNNLDKLSQLRKKSVEMLAETGDMDNGLEKEIKQVESDLVEAKKARTKRLADESTAVSRGLKEAKYNLDKNLSEAKVNLDKKMKSTKEKVDESLQKAVNNINEGMKEADKKANGIHVKVVNNMTKYGNIAKNYLSETGEAIANAFKSDAPKVYGLVTLKDLSLDDDDANARIESEIGRVQLDVKKLNDELPKIKQAKAAFLTQLEDANKKLFELHQKIKKEKESNLVGHVDRIAAINTEIDAVNKNVLSINSIFSHLDKYAEKVELGKEAHVNVYKRLLEVERYFWVKDAVNGRIKTLTDEFNASSPTKEDTVALKRYIKAIQNKLAEYKLRVETGGPHMSCLLYTSPSPRDQRGSRMPSSA